MVFVEKYMKDKKQWDKDHVVTMVNIAPSNSYAFNQSLFLQTIDNVQDMSDSELRKFIKLNFNNIIENIFNGNTPHRYLKCFTDKRFLDIFNEVISNFNSFNYSDIVRLNTIAYHYLSLPKEQKDQSIIDSMLAMSRIINRAYFPRLLGLGLSTTLATMLLMARNSDINLNICVKRVDFIIITQPKELMSENMIKEIFRILYDIPTTFQQVFQYVMLDVTPEYNENDNTTWWVTNEIQEVDAALSVAILDILDNLTSMAIKSILINYAEGKRLTCPDKPVRFSMRRLGEEYYRINEVISSLEYEEDNIIVP